MTQQRWDPDTYARNARFVSDLGAPVLELLAPQPGERILDLGCGDGALTARLAAIGSSVVGVDASAAQVEAARRLGLDARGGDGERLNPWYFPTVEDYSARLVRGGFAIRYIALIPRPTPLPTEINGWLETFAQAFMAPLEAGDRARFIDEVRESLRPDLCSADGKWFADYMRLRFAADKLQR